MKMVATALIGVHIATASAAASDELNVRLQADDRKLTITNRMSGKLENCRVSLNSRYIFGRFDVGEGERFEILFSELMSQNDVRFDAWLERIRHVFIGCRQGSIMLGP